MHYDAHIIHTHKRARMGAQDARNLRDSGTDWNNEMAAEIAALISRWDWLARACLAAL